MDLDQHERQEVLGYDRPNRYGIGLIRLSDSGFTLEDATQDVRGLNVYDNK